MSASVSSLAQPGRGASPPATETLQRLEAWLTDRQRQRSIAMRGSQMTVDEQTGSPSRYHFDAQGDLTEIIEPNGVRTSYYYDQDRRLRQVDAVSGTTRYHYDAQDRLVAVEQGDVTRHYAYDQAGRLTADRHGAAGAIVYRYDPHGRVALARTALVATEFDYDQAGRIVRLCQTLDGVGLTARLTYDAAGRLATLTLPGSDQPLQYRWDARGRPLAVTRGERPLADYAYDDALRQVTITYPSGVTMRTQADPIDGRPVSAQVTHGATELWRHDYRYTSLGQIAGDGQRDYQYDRLGRLIAAVDHAGPRAWQLAYDGVDNRTTLIDAAGQTSYEYDAANRLTRQQGPAGAVTWQHDERGRPVYRLTPTGDWSYRFDDAGRLCEVAYRGDRRARFTYDHKGRLILGEYPERAERYLYGPADELLAVTDRSGRPISLTVPTPCGPVARIAGPVDSGALIALHHDHHGTVHLTTAADGSCRDRFAYDPFGQPMRPAATSAPASGGPCFGGRLWCEEVQLYWFGARWYDPSLGRFLTPDSYSGAPDDERLVHPLWPGRRQSWARGEILGDWLQQPRVRNRYVFCRNDPLNHVDPNGHWSFSGVLLSLLGAIWTLPNTLIGLLIEITCLVGEVVRWLVWLVSLGNVSWETPGFDVAASGHLNAFALVFSGGWFGSFSSILGMTFGNVFFVYKNWEQEAEFKEPGVIYPSAYRGQVAIPRREALYEHELRHTNQYGWFGPFFLVGLPIWGVYVWDVIFNGYENAWLERDARAHGGIERH